MASYNIYIKIFITRKKVFSAKFPEIDFFSKYLVAIAQIRNDFVWKVKEKSTWQIAKWGKYKIDNLARLIYDYNVIHQESKTS